MKKIISSLMLLVLTMSLLITGVSAERTSNVWDAVGSAAEQKTQSNVWEAVLPANEESGKSNVIPAYEGSSAAELPVSQTVTSPSSESNAGQTTTVDNDNGELPTATQGVVEDSDYSMPYVIKVDRTNQVITVFKASEPGVYNIIVKQFICSTGTKKDPTPEGVFTLPNTSRKEWRYFKTYNTYVRYAVHIEGNYFFHSLLYSKPDLSTMSRTSYRKLGTPASHGCIRMMDDDVKWLSENCLAGTDVFVMDCQKDSALNKSLLPPKLK